jgi:lipoprotein-anchoring transpeptidase ErfK/SrfK
VFAVSSVLIHSVVAAPTELTQTLNELKSSQQRWLEIDLSDQQLIAWEGGTTRYTTTVSTGKPSTPTHSGIFTIQRKLPEDRMRGADYDVPNVPDVMYYHRGYAIHGAYWHNQFGTRVSHGCVNLPLEAAAQIYEWTSIGTPVVIHD